MPKHYLVICLMIIWSTSCKDREEPEEQTGNPVFRITGNAGSYAVDLAGGVSDYYMTTRYSVDQYQVYTFAGQLKKDNCTDCGLSLNIMLRNYTHEHPFDITQADQPGNYAYYYGVSPIDSIYRVELSSVSTGAGIPDMAWDFSNGVTSNETNPVITFNTGGIYTLTGNAFFVNGCNSSLAQPVFLTPTRVGKNTDFNVNHLDTFRLLFNSIPVDNTATVSWDFGDTQTGSGTIISHTYASGGIYRVCMEYIKGNDTMQFCRNVNTLDVTDCKANYTFNTSLTIDSLNLSEVVVEWRGADGVLYSSANVRQPQKSSFTITEAKEYTTNENGQKTRQLTVQFNCIVSNGTATLELTDMRGKIAVAYP